MPLPVSLLATLSLVLTLSTEDPLQRTFPPLIDLVQRTWPALDTLGVISVPGKHQEAVQALAKTMGPTMRLVVLDSPVTESPVALAQRCVSLNLKVVVVLDDARRMGVADRERLQRLQCRGIAVVSTTEARGPWEVSMAHGAFRP